jgi:hypothetical protein
MMLLTSQLKTLSQIDQRNAERPLEDLSLVKHAIGNMDSGEGDQSRTQKNRRTVLAPPLEEEDQVGKAEGEGDEVGIGEAQIVQHPNDLARQGELLHAASHNIK